MQLIINLSLDNYIARSEDDNLEWLECNKNVIKLLSSTNEGICCMSRKSINLMPKLLFGREIVEVSRDSQDLNDIYKLYKYGNLICGQTLAKVAIKKDYIKNIFLLHAPIKLREGIKFNLRKFIEEKYNLVQYIKIDGVVVHHYQHKFCDQLK